MRPLTLTMMLTLMLTACEGGSTTVDEPVGDATAVVERDIGEVLAEVNGMKVGSSDFAQSAARVAPADGKELTLEERKEVLQTLIDDKLLYEEALRQGLDQDPKVQKVMVNTLLREQVYSQVRNSDFSDDELRAYYDEHKEDFVVPEKVQVKRILIRVNDTRTDEEAKALANDVRGQIAPDPKTKFKEAAATYSEDPYKRRGGDVGFVSAAGKPGLDTAIVTKAFELDNGQLSDVFLTDDGYNIVYIANRRERVERTFQQMKGSVLRKVKNQRLKEMYDEYVEGLKVGATITVHDDKLMAVEVKAARRPTLNPTGPGGPGLDPEMDLGEGNEMPALPFGDRE
jgi:peptidyl-prolyl cis-trans isomerase C